MSGETKEGKLLLKAEISGQELTAIVAQHLVDKLNLDKPGRIPLDHLVKTDIYWRWDCLDDQGLPTVCAIAQVFVDEKKDE